MPCKKCERCGKHKRRDDQGELLDRYMREAVMAINSNLDAEILNTFSLQPGAINYVSPIFPIPGQRNWSNRVIQWRTGQPSPLHGDGLDAFQYSINALAARVAGPSELADYVPETDRSEDGSLREASTGEGQLSGQPDRDS